jgi:hypothetical protein
MARLLRDGTPAQRCNVARLGPVSTWRRSLNACGECSADFLDTDQKPPTMSLVSRAGLPARQACEHEHPTLLRPMTDDDLLVLFRTHARRLWRLSKVGVMELGFLIGVFAGGQRWIHTLDVQHGDVAAASRTGYRPELTGPGAQASSG